jgi:hypothetical protein
VILTATCSDSWKAEMSGTLFTAAFLFFQPKLVIAFFSHNSSAIGTDDRFDITFDFSIRRESKTEAFA